jgi:hypothetical protein
MDGDSVWSHVAQSLDENISDLAKNPDGSFQNQWIVTTFITSNNHSIHSTTVSADYDLRNLATVTPIWSKNCALSDFHNVRVHRLIKLFTATNEIIEG